MPTYEYRCDECDSVFEAWQGINDDALTECRECGASGVRRLISSGGGLVFKGPGFYATDYRSGPSGGSSKDSSTGTGGSDEGSGSSGTKSAGSDD